MYFFYWYCNSLHRLLIQSPVCHSLQLKSHFLSRFTLNYFLPAGVTRLPQLLIATLPLPDARTLLLAKRHVELPIRGIEKVACNDHRIIYFLGYYIEIYNIFWERAHLICSRGFFWKLRVFFNSNIITIKCCNSSGTYAHYALHCLRAATAFLLLNLTHKSLLQMNTKLPLGKEKMKQLAVGTPLGKANLQSGF